MEPSPLRWYYPRVAKLSLEHLHGLRIVGKLLVPVDEQLFATHLKTDVRFMH